MTIRLFKQADFQAINNIYNVSKLDELQLENTSFELLSLEQDQQRYAELMESDIYVYEHVYEQAYGQVNKEPTVLGYGALFGTEIRALFVLPQARRKSIGKTLLEFLLTKIDGTASLYVARSNTPAKTLYATYDFNVVEEFTTTYNTVPVVANKMLRQLDEQ